MMKIADCRLLMAGCRARGRDGKPSIGICRLPICGLFVFLMVAVLPSAALAQKLKPPEFVGVRVGIADYYKAGVWTQVEVTLLGGSDALTGEVSVIVPDGDDVPGRVSPPPTRPCEVFPGRTTVVRLVTRFGQVDGDLLAEFRVGGRVVASRTFKAAMQADDEHFREAFELQKLIVSVGGAPLHVEGESKPGRLNADATPAIAQVTDIERLPSQWYAYEGVDAVVLLTSRPEMYGRLAANNARVQALDQWVRMGGRLVLCVGSQGEEILSENHPLRRFAPGRFDKKATLGQTGAIETYAGSRSSIGLAAGGKPKLQVSRLKDVQGVVEVDEGGIPLVVRTARGFGQVIFVAVDLDQWPLDKWPDRPLLVARLLDMPTTHADESAENAAMMHYGYIDLAGQLRSGLDKFAGVHLVPFWLVAGLIVGYILLIGPADYFFLRKVVRRMEWTWLTFPLIVALVCLGAYVLAYKLKGNQIRVNQIDLVDVDAASGKMRGAAWMNVFSPRMESFSFTVEPRGADGQPMHDARVLMAWLGLTGNGSGGMNRHAGGSLLWTEQFLYATDLNALYNVPIQVWSTKSLTARWSAPGAAFPAADLSESDRVLSGSISNTLPFRLRDCVLVHRNSAYDLGTLAPGESIRLGPAVKRTELKTFLTKVLGETDRMSQQASAYNQSSTNLAYILQTMMFYRAAGGRHYARLWNSYQDFVDLSDLLKTGRAILFTKTPMRAAEGHQGAELLGGDGKPLAGRQERHETIYRFIFPVKNELSATK
jgi:hypothetical protein